MSNDNSVADWKKIYKSGYGIQFPESHVIRTWVRVLQFELGWKPEDKRSFLDFGCGTGAHLAYFEGLGFNVSGVDVAEDAISHCKERFSSHPEQFVTIAHAQNLEEVFQKNSFDLILANQSLYYLNDSELKDTLAQFKTLLKPGGVLLASMMGPGHNYLNYVVDTSHTGLKRIEANYRGHMASWINFVDSKEEMLELFSNLKVLHLGWYDFVIREQEGSSFHYWIICQK